MCIYTVKKQTKKKIPQGGCATPPKVPKSLLVFAVFFTPETPNFGTFGGVAHSP